MQKLRKLQLDALREQQKLKAVRPKIQEQQRNVPSIFKQKPLDPDNIGGLMMKKMGWKAGQGLGPAGKGMVDPLLPHLHKKGAGLGSIPKRTTKIINTVNSRK